MNNLSPHIAEVVPNADYTLLVSFTDGTERLFDMKPYLTMPVFQPLQDPDYFYRVAVRDGKSIEWPNHQDIHRDTLYVEGKDVANSKTL